MDLLSVNECNPVMQDTESTNALRAINLMDLLGVKSRASRGSGEGLSTSHTRFCNRVTAGLFYVNRFQAPAFFAPKKADEDIQQYSHRLGESPRIIRRRGRAGDAILAVWGTVELKPLDSESIAALGKGSSSKDRYLIDFIGNVARSAKEGLPIYRISGGT